MKKSLITLALLASLSFGQTNTTVQAGVKNVFAPNVLFGGNPFLTITPSTDTTSDVFLVETQNVRPGTFFAIEYKGISADSASSGFDITIESRFCTTPTNNTTCPTQWLTRRFRTLLNNQHFADSINVALIPQDTTQFSHSSLIPTGNQWRLRVNGNGSSYTNFWKVVGY